MFRVLLRTLMVLLVAVTFSACAVPFSDNGSNPSNNENTEGGATTSGGTVVPVIPSGTGGGTVTPVIDDIDTTKETDTDDDEDIPPTEPTKVNAGITISKYMNGSLGVWLLNEQKETGGGMFVLNCEHNCTPTLTGAPKGLSARVEKKKDADITFISGAPLELGTFDNIELKICKNDDNTNCGVQKFTMAVKENVAIKLYKKADVDGVTMWVPIPENEYASKDSVLTMPKYEWVMARVISSSKIETSKEGSIEDKIQGEEETGHSTQKYSWSINGEKIPFPEMTPKNCNGGEGKTCVITSKTLQVSIADPDLGNPTFPAWNETYSTVFIRATDYNKSTSESFEIAATDPNINENDSFKINSIEFEADPCLKPMRLGNYPERAIVYTDLNNPILNSNISVMPTNGSGQIAYTYSSYGSFGRTLGGRPVKFHEYNDQYIKADSTADEIELDGGLNIRQTKDGALEVNISFKLPRGTELFDDNEFQSLKNEVELRVDVSVQDTICDPNKRHVAHFTHFVTVLPNNTAGDAFKISNTEIKQFMRVGFNDTGSDSHFNVYLRDPDNKVTLAKWRKKREADPLGDSKGYGKEDQNKYDVNPSDGSDSSDKTFLKFYDAENDNFDGNLLDIRDIGWVNYRIDCGDWNRLYDGYTNYSFWEYELKAGEWCGQVTKIIRDECSSYGYWATEDVPIIWRLGGNPDDPDSCTKRYDE